LWLSALAAFNNCQLTGQFTSSEQLKQAAAQWVCLFQEALIKAFSTQSAKVKTRQGIPLVDRCDQSLKWNASSIDENGQQLPYNVNRSSESVKEALVDLVLLSQSIPIPTSTSTFLELSLFLNPIYGSLIGYLFYLRSKLKLL
jgi:hypothetical protein